ncbi:Cysteine protease atg4a [Thoreauomyces humboldtii]|nr:Cysteine protease atg4a [Thoreauomyces humboldtii]
MEHNSPSTLSDLPSTSIAPTETQTIPPASSSPPPGSVTLWSKVSEGLTNFFYVTSERLRPTNVPGANMQGPISFLGGVSYPTFTDPAFLSDFQSRPWMTYRKDYPPIQDSSYTSDAAWGCMLRTGQMMLASTLLVHKLGRDWRLAWDDKDTRSWSSYRKITGLFLDAPSAPYSIHRIAAAGTQYGKKIGEWFGPSTIAHVLKKLVMEEKECPLTIHVATDGVIYIDVVTAECLQRDQSWKSVLILLPLMLGLEGMNPVYHQALKACFTFKQCVGIAGGKPNSSYFFVGTADESVLYLDPHIMRPAVDIKDVESSTKNDFSSYHCETVRTIPLISLDPSLVLGFYCRDRADFDSLCVTAQEVAKASTPIFSIEKREPEFQDRDVDVISDNDDF